MKKKIALVGLRYPYGKDQIYLNGSLAAIGVRLATEYEVEFIDLNIDRLKDQRVGDILQYADIIGTTVFGAPYIPGAIDFAKEMTECYPATPILVGGQGINKVRPEEFTILFAGTNAVLVGVDEVNLNRTLERSTHLPSIFQMPHSAFWERIDPERRRMYFSNEFSLLISQGCKFQCHFCGAEKKQQETFVDLDVFRADLDYLVSQAREFGLESLSCYTTSLDFFQNPKLVAQHLEILADVSENSGIRFNLRCLSCMNSFIAGDRQIPDLEHLLKRAGLTTIAFGLDGIDPKVWKSEGKWQNETGHVSMCLDRCTEMGIKPELLFVIGFGRQTAREEQVFMDHNIDFALEVFEKWPDAVFRPYLAKSTIPGNDNWRADNLIVQELLRDPKKFYNLDFCAYPSAMSHPDPAIRKVCHDGFKKFVEITTKADRCFSFPLYPQGEDGAEGERNAILNQSVEFDR